MTLTRTLAATYEHQQETAATSWVINHNLGTYPAVDVFVIYQGENHKILPSEVVYVDANTCTLEFSVPRSGFATVA